MSRNQTVKPVYHLLIAEIKISPITSSGLAVRWVPFHTVREQGRDRAETKSLIGGGGAYSYIRVLPDEFLLKSTVMTTDFKRNSSGRTRIYEYAPP